MVPRPARATRPLLCLAGLLAAAPVAARPSDVEGWQDARWGADRAALDHAFAGRLQPLPKRWLFFGAYAERVLRTSFAGVPFLAVFQLGERDGRLQQVMLEARPPQASPQAHARVGAALDESYGPADASCVEPKPEGEPMVVERVWRFPTTTIHATYLDFFTTGVFSEAPDIERDLLEPSFERRRNHWRTMPRRIIVRYHPTARTDLVGKCRPH